MLNIESLTLSKFIMIKVCYNGYGCFYDYWELETIINRPITPLPVQPSSIATKFELYTRENSNSGVYITADSPGNIFGANKMTRFIVHGFLETLSNKNKTWVYVMKNALLKQEDSNVIIVDWRNGNRPS